jgi:hypothetical protein
MQPIQVNKIFDDFLQSGPPNVHVQRINTIKSEKSGTNSAPQVVPIEQVGVPLGFFGLGDANKMAADAAKVAAEAAIKYILGKVKTPESTEEIIETELSLAKACIGPSDQERGMTNLKLQKKISKLDQYQEHLLRNLPIGEIQTITCSENSHMSTNPKMHDKSV